MSDTPETDAAELIYDGIVASGYVDSEVCRKLERERDEAQRALVKARDRCLKLGRERNHWKSESLEQAKLLAISADREEKLRADLTLARKLADSAMLESDRMRAQLHKQQT